jgi:cbb3-type cytochrome oxidase maturation protein
MDILYLLIPLSVVLVFLIGAAFYWSVRSGQYDDLEGPGHRILMDDDRPRAAADRQQADAAGAAPDTDTREDRLP